MKGDALNPVNTSKEAIAEWCRGYVADLLEMPAESVGLDTGFDRLGIDSAIAVSLLIEVEERYGVELPAEALFGNPNLNALAEYLSVRARPNLIQPNVAQPNVAGP
jgi:acyl carrier protein